MSTTLATVNPEGAARAADDRPLPGVGDVVIYYPRTGEVQRGRTRLPALVMKADVDNRLLELVIIRGVDDWMEQTNVPERRGDDRGWERKDGPASTLVAPAGEPGGQLPGAQITHNHAPAEVGALREAVDGLRNLVLGEYEVSPKPVLELIDALDERVDRVERAITAPPSPSPSRVTSVTKTAKKRAKKKGK